MDFYMMKAGVQCDDVRLKRLVALIGQKFITDIANDAMHHHRVRVGGTGASLSTSSSTATASSGTGRRTNTLTLEDLSAALSDYGINIKRPSYYT
jgi:transcription initiation factor TFIID subunit 10